MKLSKQKIFFIIIISFAFLIGCSRNKSYIEDYEYGLLYTSNSGSVVSLYDKQGENLGEKNLNVSGITFGSFMKNGIEVKDKLYYAAPLAGSNQQDFVVEMDKDKLSVSKIKSTGVTPTFFSSDGKYTFSGISSLNNSQIIKTDIEKNKVIGTNELEGQGINMIEDGNQLYILSINHNDSGKSTSGNLYTIDKSSFKVLNKIVVEDISFTCDTAKISNYIYILVTNDGLDNKTNKVRRISLKDGSIKEFNLPFKNLSKIHINNDDIYIVESDVHREEICNNVAKLDIKTGEIKSFNVEGNILSSIIADNKFILSDGKKVYVHNLNDFKLEKEFDAKSYDNKVFVSIFKK